MANQMGKRYTCSVCEATVLVTKAGDGELSCHGAGDGDRPGQAAPLLRLTHPPPTRSSRGATVNIAMILEMAADALGDRVAFGNRDDGLSYEGLRRAARAIADRVDDSRRRAPRADRAQQPPRARHALRGRVGGRELRPAQLPAPRRPARGADRPHRAVDHRRRPTGSTPRARRSGRSPSRPSSRRCCCSPAARRRRRRPRCSSTTSSSPTCSTRSSSGRAGEDEAAHHVVAAVPHRRRRRGAQLHLQSAGASCRSPACASPPRTGSPPPADEAVTHAIARAHHARPIVEVDGGRPEDARVPSLRSLVYGGARMPAPVLERALQLFPETDFVNAYGLTETSSTVALLGPDDHRLALYSDDPVFNGAPRRRSASRCPGIEIRIVDESGADARHRRARRDPDPGRPGGRRRTSAPSPRSTPTAGSTPATAAGSTSRATCSARAAPTTPSSAAARTSARPRSRTPSCTHDAVSTAAVVGLADEEWGERIVAAMISLRARRRGDRHRGTCATGCASASARSRRPS